MKKTVVVTGGSSGIGKEISEEFYNRGFDVFTVGKTKDKKDINENIKHFVVDVSNYEDVNKFINEISNIDILINCAGVINQEEESEMFDINTLNNVIDINLKGTIIMCGLAIDKMLNNKSKLNIINIASILADTGSKYFPTYASSKAGVVSYTKSIASRYCKKGLRCNVISPGIIETPMSYFETSNFKDYIPDLIEKHCLDRIGKPSDIANIVLFLTDDKSEFITGQEIVVDGGYTLSKD